MRNTYKKQLQYALARVKTIIQHKQPINVQDISAIVAREPILPVTFCIRSRHEFDRACKTMQAHLDRDACIESIVKDMPGTFKGFCSHCNHETSFIVEQPWTTYTEGVICPCCKLNSRLRLVFDIAMEFLTPDMDVYTSEYVTPFFKDMSQKITNLVGSEYIPDDMYNQKIRHEDITCLSFKSETFDMYISNDVFEHVSDYIKAFQEAYRILRKNGIFILHIPFYFLDKTTPRAEFDERGELVFLKDAIYHGNPISEKGSLVFTDFGWDLFDIARTVGFHDVYMYLKNDLEKGYLQQTSFAFILKK